MTNYKHTLWVEKYRPQSIDQYIFQNKEHKIKFQQMVSDQTIPHLILYGMRGTGKTSLARILINSLDIDPSDAIEINASSERGMDTFRNKIENFTTTMAFGRFKIIHLEEADKLTPDAQTALKSLMETTSEHVRFIFTTNHVNKLIPEIRSRCHEYAFKAADRYDITEQMIQILAAEHIKFDLETLDRYVASYYPDMRKIINVLQENAISGVLTTHPVSGDNSDWRSTIAQVVETNEWSLIRDFICTNVPTDEYEDLYRVMYDNVHKLTKFSKSKQLQSDAIVIIAEHLYKHTFVADPEINAIAMFIRLQQL